MHHQLFTWFISLDFYVFTKLQGLNQAFNSTSQLRGNMLPKNFLKKGKARGGKKRHSIQTPKYRPVYSCFLIHINNGYHLSVQITQVMNDEWPLQERSYCVIKLAQCWWFRVHCLQWTFCQGKPSMRETKRNETKRNLSLTVEFFFQKTRELDTVKA